MDPFSQTELHEAMDAMKDHKCPGPDGATVEFFQTLWATVGPLLTQVLNQGITAGEFTERFSLGLIVLLPKKGDRRFLSNKRPISNTFECCVLNRGQGPATKAHSNSAAYHLTSICLFAWKKHPPLPGHAGRNVA